MESWRSIKKFANQTERMATILTRCRRRRRHSFLLLLLLLISSLKLKGRRLCSGTLWAHLREAPFASIIDGFRAAVRRPAGGAKVNLGRLKARSSSVVGSRRSAAGRREKPTDCRHIRARHLHAGGRRADTTRRQLADSHRRRRDEPRASWQPVSRQSTNIRQRRRQRARLACIAIDQF